ncbi:ribonuclease H-like domain-containing protein [Tanacetum coccineum]|uniref:Ribonuclease H-like domain-containing protein n=1 Tax=Tanacetum coccineum TaxID=301880 RepID=A0ABQ4YQG2_9ASTR
MRKNHFATLRAQEKRSKPPTKARNRNTMSTYLKNMAGYKHNQMKSKIYDEIQEMFDKELKWVNTFVDMNTGLVKRSETRTEGCSKRAGDELESDKSKKQKIDEHVEAEKDDNQEEAEMKKHTEIVKDDEVAIDVIPLATKPPMIVKYKIVKEGKFVYFQLIRANGSLKIYLSMIKMLQNIDRDDLETLWKLVKAKHGNTRLEDEYERVLWGDMKDVIVNGDAPVIASASVGTEANPNEHLLKFHGIKDAKTLWEEIKARFGENTSCTNEIVNTAHEVFAASSLGQASSLNYADDVMFSFFDNQSNKNTSCTNEVVNTAHEVSAASSQGQASSLTYADDVMFSFFANQSNSPQLENEDLEQIDTDDLEQMDLKWQVAMLSMRVKRFLKKTIRNLNFNSKETVGFDKTKVECYNCHRRGHFVRECRAPRNQGNRNGDGPRRNAPVDTSTTNALVVQDGIGGYDWSFQAEEGITNFALMAYTSQGSSSSDSENEALYEEDISFLKYDVQVKDISIKDLKNQLEEALKEKDDLKLKLEKFEESLKNLTKLKECNVDDSLVNNRFNGNYMPSRPDLSFVGLDDSVYKTKVK